MFILSSLQWSLPHKVGYSIYLQKYQAFATLLVNLKFCKRFMRNNFREKRIFQYFLLDSCLCFDEKIQIWCNIEIVRKFMEAVTQNSTNPLVVLTTEAPDPFPPFSCTYRRYFFQLFFLNLMISIYLITLGLQRLSRLYQSPIRGVESSWSVSLELNYPQLSHDRRHSVDSV